MTEAFRECVSLAEIHGPLGEDGIAHPSVVGAVLAEHPPERSGWLRVLFHSDPPIGQARIGTK